VLHLCSHRPDRLVALAACCAGIALAGALRAQSSNPDPLSARVDQAVLAQLRQQKIPGVSLGVMRDAKIIKARGYGLANVELEVPAAPRSGWTTVSRSISRRPRRRGRG